MKLVKSLRMYGHIRVYNALLMEGYEWRNPKHSPRNVDTMLEGIPRVVLVRILIRLNASGKRVSFR